MIKSFISNHFPIGAAYHDADLSTSTFCNTEPFAVYEGMHTCWSDRLIFYANGSFRRENSGCSGYYEVSSRSLTLKWFDWDEEQLAFLSGNYLGSRLILKMLKGSRALYSGHEANESDLFCVQLGCGPNIIPGWLNLDLPHFDITKPLPWGNNELDALFLEHVIEHITGPQVYSFLEEAYRVLKPGGVLRLAFPDIVRIARDSTPKYINFLHDCGWTDGSPQSGIKCVVVNHGHQTVWSAETLKIVIDSVGFETKIWTPGVSEKPFLKNLERHWIRVGKDLNNLETSCIEATKVIV